MTANISRRDLFRRTGLAQQSQGNNQPAGINPPWAIVEFAQICDGCGACVKSCPEGLLVQDNLPVGSQDIAFPRVEFGTKECVFCGDCVDACDRGALVPADLLSGDQPDPATAFPHHMHITARCLSWRGISCRLCEENCEPRAIGFHLQTEGRAAPDLDDQICTGCGACMAVCPEQAVVISDMASPVQAVTASQGGK